MTHLHEATDPTQRRFALAVGLNLAFCVAEGVGGLHAHSAALLSDALHNLADVTSLALAWFAHWLSRRPPAADFTYGLGSSSILAAIANAALLLVACGGLAWEALGRLAAPPIVATPTVIVLAAIGVGINGVSALLFAAHQHADLNQRGAYLHLLGDAAVSASVLATGIAIGVTAWYWLDPLATLLILAVILRAAWRMLREAMQLGLHGVPANLRVDAIAAELRAQPGVAEVHDLHVWALSTRQVALTAHLVMPDGHPGDPALDAIAAQLHARFGIAHSTLQVEFGEAAHQCTLHETEHRH